jgi:uncharacterized iron-regulated membrane protein
VPGRILLSVMGVVVALLSATGIVIWFKKRAARLGRASRGEPEPTPSRSGAAVWRRLGRPKPYVTS